MLIPRALPARAHTFALETCRDVLAKLEWEIQGLDDEQEMPALAFRPFNCAVTAWHLADWIWKALGPRRRTWGGDEEAFRHACRDLCPALKHCWLIANASKHGGLDLHKRKQISTEIRSEKFQPPWIGQAQVTALALSRLDRRDGAVLVERAAGKSMPDELLAQIVERTDGVPLFVEELTKTVLESGLLREHEGRWVLDGPLPALAIPATLHASLIARLDRLSAVKEVAQAAAAIGREFSYELIAAVSPLPKGALDRALGELIEAGLVFSRGEPPNATYTFKHALSRRKGEARHAFSAAG